MNVKANLAISHKWDEDNKCICGCERRGTGTQTRYSKDGFETYEKYIECTRPTTDKQKLWRDQYQGNKGKNKRPVRDEVQRSYFKIAHVATVLEVKESAIRYWDCHFNLNIKQNSSGVRFFTEKNIEKLAKIKEMRFVRNLDIDQVKKELV